MAYTEAETPLNAQQQLEAAIKAINSGKARLEDRIVGAGDESFGSWETVLVGDDGKVFNDVIATNLGNGQVKLKTSAPSSYGKNSYVGITTSVDPKTGVLSPLTSQNQVSLGKTVSSGGSLWTDLRDAVESAGVIAGNYVLPGSSLVTSKLVSEGAKEQLSAPELQLANAVAGGVGGYQGNLSNYGTVGNALGITEAAPVSPVDKIATSYYGGPTAVEALTSGAATTPAEAIASTQVVSPAVSAAIANPESAAAIAAAVPSEATAIAAALPEYAAEIATAVPEYAAEISAVTDFTGVVPAEAAYIAPEVSAGTQLAALAPDAAIATDAGAGTALSNVANAPDAIDIGGGWNPATGAGDFVAGTTLSDIAAGNADKAVLLGGEGYGAGMTGAETAAYDTGLAAGTAGTVGAANAVNAASGAGTTLADILPYTAGAGVVGAYLQSDAAKSAADKQSEAAQAAIAQQQKNFETINAQQAPYRAAGYGALNKLANLGSGQTQQYDANGNPIGAITGATDYLTHQFNAQDLKSGLAPNYDFMLQQGQMANQRAANAGGGALGGNALQGLNKYTQDYAGNAYQNAFNNYQTQRSNIYNTLAGIAGIGQTGQNATNTAATNATNAATQLGVGSAAAQAAGTTGSANAYANALNNVTNQYTLASLLNQGGRVAQ